MISQEERKELSREKWLKRNYRSEYKMHPDWEAVVSRGQYACLLLSIFVVLMILLLVVVFG